MVSDIGDSCEPRVDRHRASPGRAFGNHPSVAEKSMISNIPSQNSGIE